MTKEQAIDTMLQFREDLLASFESKEWLRLDYVATTYVDVNIKLLEVLEAYDLIDVRIGYNKATTFRVKAQGYKLARQYK